MWEREEWPEFFRGIIGAALLAGFAYGGYRALGVLAEYVVSHER